MNTYGTNTEWVTGRRGKVQAEGLPRLTVCTPPEFKGEAGFWTPEHFFVAAAEFCLMATFIGIAENSRLRVVSYRSSAAGKLEWFDGVGWRFTEITISPVVELESDAQRTLAERVMVKAEKGCLIANSVSASLLVRPQFLVPATVAV